MNSEETVKYPTNVTNSILINESRKELEDQTIYTIDHQPVIEEKVEEKHEMKKEKPEKK